MPISFRCPTCKALLTVEDDAAGLKASCITCGQRLLVPAPPTPKPAAANKTVLGELELLTANPAPIELLDVEFIPDHPASAPVRLPRARSDDDDDADYRPRRSRRRRRRDYDDEYGFRCPFCNSTRRPETTSRISTGGWITFALLLIFFFPLFWVGFFITEEKQCCADCGCKVG